MHLGRFAGAVDPAHTNLLVCIAARVLVALDVGAGDQRVRDAIDAWIDELLVSYAARARRRRAETV